MGDSRREHPCVYSTVYIIFFKICGYTHIHIVFFLYIYIYMFLIVHTGHGMNMGNSPENVFFFDGKGWLICETLFGSM